MPTKSDLIGAEVAHSTFVERLGKGDANKVIDYLKEADAYISKRLKREGETIRNQTRLLKVQADIRSRLNALYSKWEKERDKNLLDLVSYEADFQIKLLDKFTIDVDFTRPADEQIVAAALRQPLLIGRGGSAIFTQKMLDKWKPDQIAMTNGAILTGFSTGQTTQQISARIRNEVLPLSRRDSDAIVITATKHMATAAKQEVFKANDDIVIGYRLVATLDDRTSNQCRSWDQTVVLNDADYKPMPPFHYRACTKGSRIAVKGGFKNIEDVCVGDMAVSHTGSLKAVTAVMAKDCDSPCVELINCFGKRVRLTNDHPVLTTVGWKAAGEIKAGDKVFNHFHKLGRLKGLLCRSKVDNAILINAHNIKTKITERLVAYKVTSFTTGVSSSVKLKEGEPKSKVRNIISAYFLKLIRAFN